MLALAILLRRIAAMLLTLWLAFTLTFWALRLLPGDGLTATLIRSGASQDQIMERRAALGLNQPLVAQYVQSLIDILQGDLGTSLMSGRPVSNMIFEQFGATATLACVGLFLGTLFGLVLGMAKLAAARLVRIIATLLITLLLSMPVYWTGTLLIYFFSVLFRLLPSAGNEGLPALILPSFALGLTLAGGIARVTANSLTDLRHADFIRTAHAKGLRRRYIAIHHLLRANLVPILSVVGLQAGFLLGGAVVTEALFVRQGIGQVMLAAVQDRDYPVVQGIVILSAITYSLINTIIDAISAFVDPRIRSESESGYPSIAANAS